MNDHTIHTRFNVYWSATFDDYDGATDAKGQRPDEIRALRAGESDD